MYNNRLSQEKVAASLGIKYYSIDLKKDISFLDFKAEIDKLNFDKNVTGIIINKPFNKDWRDEDVFSLIKKFFMQIILD